MRRVLITPEYDESLAHLCAALRVAQRHRREPLVLEGVCSWSALATGRDASSVAVLTVPAPDAGQLMAGFRAQVDALLARAPNLPVFAMLPPPLSLRAFRGGPTLRALGVHEILPCPEEETPWALARRLERRLRSAFALNFLETLATQLSSRQWLVLARLLEELRRGVVLSPEELAAACQRDPEALGTALELEGRGTLEDWRRRALVYAVFRSAEEEESTLRDSAERLGFDRPGGFNAACRIAAGSSARELEALDGWRALLELMVNRIDADLDDAGGEPTDEAADCKRQEVEQEPPAFNALVERYRHIVVRVASARLGSDEYAEDVAQEVFLRVFRRDPESWQTLSEGFFVRAARDGAVDLLRKWARNPEEVEFDKIEVPCTGRSPEIRLLEVETELMVQERLRRLPPGRGLAVWLCDLHGWPPREAAALLGRSSHSLRKLRSRGRQQLASSLRRPS